MSEAQIATLAMQFLPTAEVGVEHLVAWIQSLVQAAQQKGEWTPEQDAMWRGLMWARTKDPKYQPSPLG
jgi:hypothetical protein